MDHASRADERRPPARVPTLAALAAAAASLLLGACSHRSPYVSGPTLPGVLKPNPALVVQRVMLIGDAGKPAVGGEPVLQALADTADNLPDETLVVFLGDNVYERGLSPAGTAVRPEEERRLRAQMEVTRTGARALFLPGNHDWADGTAEGLETLRRQARWIHENGEGLSSFMANPGCPGPDVLDLETGVRIIALDTQWWFHGHTLPWEECGVESTAQVARRLGEAVREAGDDHVVIVGHHPLETEGTHGGFWSWDKHLFPLTQVWDHAWLPLPVLGSIYPWVVRPLIYQHPQDVSSDTYRRFQREVREAVASEQPLIFAGGHEHSLQLFQSRSVRYSVVSGAGSRAKVSGVGHGERTLFAHEHVGFMVLDFMSDGSVLLRVVEPTESPEDEAVPYSRWLVVAEPAPGTTR